MNPCIQRPIRLLRFVLEVDLSKGQTHALRRRLVIGTAMYNTGNDDVIHLNDEEFLLRSARLPMGDCRFLQVGTRGTRFPPAAGEPVFVTPHENESTSISSLCFESSDSPLISPIFAKMSDAIWTLLKNLQQMNQRISRPGARGQEKIDN
jgi:hypothetical protein